MPLKPYLVGITGAIVVMAESEDEARRWADGSGSKWKQVLFISNIQAMTKETAIPWTWNLDDLVFGDHADDITLAQALENADSTSHE